MTPIIESRRLAHLDDHLAALTLERNILRGGLDESFDAPAIPVE